MAAFRPVSVSKSSNLAGHVWRNYAHLRRHTSHITIFLVILSRNSDIARSKFLVQLAFNRLACILRILSDIFLAKLDRSVEAEMTGIADKAFHFIDDYLVFIDARKAIRAGNALELFKRIGHNGLNFTMETPNEGMTQFLDLRLKFEQDHVCWAYAPRS